MQGQRRRQRQIKGRYARHTSKPTDSIVTGNNNNRPCEKRNNRAGKIHYKHVNRKQSEGGTKYNTKQFKLITIQDKPHNKT